MPTLYAPGATPVAVTPHGFVVLGSETPHTLAARIRSLVADGRGLGGVIEALTGAYGTSLTAIPPFAVALAEGDAVRIAVRGDIAFDVEATSSERVSGAGVTTWTERLVSGVIRVVFAPENSVPAELPVNDAVVLASVVTWDAAGASAASSTVEPKSASATPSARVAPVAPGERVADPERVAKPEPVVGPKPVVAPEPEPDAEHAHDPLADPEPEPARSALASNPLAVPAPEPAPSKPASAKRGAAQPEPVEQPVGAAPAPETPGLIDSRAVLSLTETLIPADSTIVHTDREAPGAPQGAPAEPPPAPADDDALGATVVRGDDGAPPIPPIPGDHDGETISLAQARAMKAAAGESPAPAVPVSPFTSPLAPPRPPAPGQVRLSTGQVVMLDRTVVIGRRPRSTRVSGTDLPHLVAVDSPQQDISRSHVELRVEGESIVATDLRTTNGTTLLRAGSEPMRLHPGEGSVVVPGDVLDLGDGITVAIEAVS